jgi:ATP-dependent DNA ligase
MLGRIILDDVAAGVVDTVHLARRLDGDGVKGWATVEERGYEGMVAKDPRSTYWSGPTRSWMKVKQRREGVFLIGGSRPAGIASASSSGSPRVERFTSSAPWRWATAAPPSRC